MSRLEQMFAYARANHPRSVRGMEEAMAMDPELFTEVAERFGGWAAGVHGDDAWAPLCVDAYVTFSNDVIMAQARYEADGHYENSSFAECEASVYADREVMDEYLWGVFLTNFLWSHHMELSRVFRDRFARKIVANANVVEIAPGHGGWGVWLLSERPDARLQAFDISPSSIAIASSIARSAGVSDRASYERRNALDLSALPAGEADACLCSFLIEHLEEPEKLVEVMAHLLKPGGKAWLTGALTAAQIDHIYEFRKESELVVMAEKYGFRVLETMSVAPLRKLPKARFVPRSMGLLLQKRTTELG